MIVFVDGPEYAAARRRMRAKKLIEAARAPAQSPPPEPPRPASSQGAGKAAAIGAAAGAAVGAIPTVAVPASGVLTAAAIGAAIKDTLYAVGRFLLKRRRYVAAKLLGDLQAKHPEQPVDVLKRIIREEIGREEEFQRKMLARLRRDLPKALEIDDPARRQAAVQAILDRERRYTAMREEAMIERASHAIEMVEIQERSPEGAYWALSVRVKEHTLDCLALGNRFWPWEVLKEIHPPLHPGCKCYLLSLDDAVKYGFMRRDQVPESKDAAREARRLYAEAKKMEEAGVTAEEFETFVEEGAYREYEHPRGRDGKWITKGQILRRAARQIGDLKAPATSQSGMFRQIEGRRVFVAAHRRFDRSFGGNHYVSPIGTTDVYRNGTLLRPGVAPVTYPAVHMDLPVLPGHADQVAGVVKALRAPKKPQRAPRRDTRQVVLRRASPESFNDYADETVALSHTLASHFKTETIVGSVNQGDLPDHAGFTDWDGNVTVGEDVTPSIRRDVGLRHKGNVQSYTDLRNIFGSYKVQAHESAHTVNPENVTEFEGPGGQALEEALAEEIGQVLATENLRRHGRTDVLQWYRSNPEDAKVVGSYTAFRATLGHLLDRLQVPPEDRERVLLDLKFQVKPKDRIDALVALGEKYGAKLSRRQVVGQLAKGRVANPDYIPPILAKHLQDIPVHRIEVLAPNGDTVGQGSVVRFKARKPIFGVLGPTLEKEGRVVRVHPLRGETYSLWIQDADGQVHYGITPEDVTATLAPPAPVLFVEHGVLFHEGTPITYHNHQGVERSGIITQVLTAGDPDAEHPQWAAEVTLADGHPVIITPGSIKTLKREGKPEVAPVGEDPLPEPPPLPDLRTMRGYEPGTADTAVVDPREAEVPSLRMGAPGSDPDEGTLVATLAKFYNMTPDAYIKQAKEIVRQLVDDEPLSIRVHKADLWKVLASGRFENQHETRTSGAVLSRDRAKVEAMTFNIPGVAPMPDRDTDKAAFHEWTRETDVFAGEHPTRFPVYGYFANNHDTAGGINGASSFGALVFRLKDDVKRRSYYTLGDSLGMFEMRMPPTRWGAEPDFRSWEIDPLRWKDQGFRTYVEAQIFGGVKLSDVDHVEIPAKYDTQGDPDRIVEYLGRFGVPWTQAGASPEQKLAWSAADDAAAAGLADPATSGRTYYHGTNVELAPGDSLEPGHGTPTFDHAHVEYTPDAVYITTSPSQAESYAASRVIHHGGKPYVYVVEPEGEPTLDPETAAMPGWQVDYRTPRARVVRVAGMEDPGTDDHYGKWTHYHGTTKEAAQEITKNGLGPLGPHKVFMASSVHGNAAAQNDEAILRVSSQATNPYKITMGKTDAIEGTNADVWVTRKIAKAKGWPYKGALGVWERLRDEGHDMVEVKWDDEDWLVALEPDAIHIHKENRRKPPVAPPAPPAPPDPHPWLTKSQAEPTPMSAELALIEMGMPATRVQIGDALAGAPVLLAALPRVLTEARSMWPKLADRYDGLIEVMTLSKAPYGRSEVRTIDRMFRSPSVDMATVTRPRSMGGSATLYINDTSPEAVRLQEVESEALAVGSQTPEGRVWHEVGHMVQGLYEVPRGEVERLMGEHDMTAEWLAANVSAYATASVGEAFAEVFADLWTPGVRDRLPAPTRARLEDFWADLTAKYPDLAVTA